MKGVDFDLWPKDQLAAWALVALVIADIGDCEEPDLEVLLHSFQRTCWPTSRAQNQCIRVAAPTWAAT